MGVFLAIVGLISLFVCTIIIIFLNKKHSLTKNSKLLLTLVPLAITFYGVWLAISPPTAPPAQTNGEESSSSSAASYTLADQTFSPQTSVKKSDELQSSSSSLIKGSSVTDLKLNLKKWGFSDANPDSTESGDDMLYHSSATDPDTGAGLDYSITSSYDFTVKSATFTIANTQNASTSSFYKLASSFLGYCSTIPYDSAQPEKAKKWIEDNISGASNSGKSITCTIGDAKFALYGNGSGSRMLEIKADS